MVLGIFKRRQSSGITELKKITLPSFEGATDPLEDGKWLAQKEKAFTTLDSIDAEKVTYAIYMLQGSAYDWWLIVKREHEQDIEPFT
ncbi:hypothetical protein PanWU01x14_328950 [Parasponia andersonii]|uniref:Retrotransposon gag domain-containing protein n=1 Tax=Parasponia andersonii TaxID=3476 RepID=A0A2P5AIL2_PARAD|nr:hypothetical protein PanWU01x14_328950 [Parasponia andersonii]